MQKAIIESLKQIEENQPEKRVALITFNDKVTVFGDGSSPVKFLEKNDLENEKEILQKFTREPPRVEPIDKNKGKLKEKIIA